jgi:hypothetical protein
MRDKDKVHLSTIPFLYRSEDKFGRFSKDMELATIFWETEANRRKEGGFLGTRGEEIAFIASGYYPFWVLPVDEKVAVIDGMSQINHRAIYHDIPSIEPFTNDLTSSGNQRNILNRIILRYQETFKSTPLEKEEKIEGLVADEDLKKDLIKILNEKRDFDKKATEDCLILEPLIAQEEVDQILNRIKSHKTYVLNQLDGITQASKLLNQKMKEQTNQTENDINEIERNYVQQLSDTKPVIEKEVDEQERDRLKEIKQITDKFEADKTENLEKLKNIDANMKKGELDKASFKNKVEIAKRKKDRSSEKAWKKTVESIVHSLITLEKQRHQIRKDIEKSRQKKELDIQRCQNYYDIQITEKMKPLRDLEAKMKNDIDSKRTEFDEIRKNYRKINVSLRTLSDVVGEDVKKLDFLTLNKNISEKAILMVPFYISAYNSGERQRYHVVSPSTTINKEGMLDTILQMIGKTEYPLTPTYPSIKNLLEVCFIRSIGEQPILKNTLSRQGEKTNIVANNDYRLLVKSGLGRLAERGWLSEKKLKEFLANPLLK